MKKPVTDTVLVTKYDDSDWYEAEVNSLLSVQFTASLTNDVVGIRFFFYRDYNITWRDPEEINMGAMKQAALKATSKPTKLKVSKTNLKKAVDKSKDKVAVKGLDLDSIIIKTAKQARSKENRERHEELSGMTVKEALATRRVEGKDLRYDLEKGFMQYK
tara:strand:- start:46 stop:525 length:480 start_codon:yes stop_codon:yes gene_type:complete